MISSGNSHFALIIGDFNVKFTNWPLNDTTISKTAQLDSLMTMCGLEGLITKPTFWKMLPVA